MAASHPMAGYKETRAGYKKTRAGYKKTRAGYKKTKAGYKKTKAGYKKTRASLVSTSLNAYRLNRNSMIYFLICGERHIIKGQRDRGFEVHTCQHVLLLQMMKLFSVWT
jgi:hypothetical protein